MSEAANQFLSEYVSRKQLADEFGVSERTVARWEALGEAPPSVVVARQRYFRRDAVREWLKSRERVQAA